jgi:hypothetical protein
MGMLTAFSDVVLVVLVCRVLLCEEFDQACYELDQG